MRCRSRIHRRSPSSASLRLLPILFLMLGSGCQSLESQQLPDISTFAEKPAGEPGGKGSTEQKSEAPTTLPQALHAYFQKVRDAKYGGPKNSEVQSKDRPGTDKSDNKDSYSKRKPKDPGDGKKEPEKGAQPDAPGAEAPAALLEKPEGKKETEKGGDPDSGKAESGNNGSDKKKEEDTPAWYSAHAQATMVLQAHDRFPSPYQGQNSLRPIDITPTSLTSTLFLDTRLWHGGDFVFNPELAGGLGFSNTMGMAGFPNGEITRIGLPQPTPYFARAFFRQTFGMGGGEETVEDDVNQIAGKRDIDRFTISIGKMAASDFFDDNRYSHDPRRQFLNWAIMYDGAWDYPANVRGYTYGFVTELNRQSWALRYGAFAEPAVANGAAFDPRFLDANGQILELEKRYQWYGRPGKIHLDAFLNHAHMGNYNEAIAEMPFSPQIENTRAYRFKYGFLANIEQELTDDLGFFARAGWNDGHSESWAFTEIDRSISFGFALKGTRWARPQDVCGLAYVCNGLSAPHRNYLAHGGYGFIIGDGALNYGHEQIFETYYCASVTKNIFISGDFQEGINPAYNRDRGPVSIFSLRVHLEM